MANLPFFLKTVHVLVACAFLGAGAAVAWVKVRADRSDDLRIVVWAHRHLVTADLVITIPSGVLLPITGVWTAVEMGWSLKEPWILAGFGGWAVAGLCWLPAWRLQYRMLALAEHALASGTPLPPAFHRATRWWTGLGAPSFAAALFTIGVMVFKRVPW